MADAKKRRRSQFLRRERFMDSAGSKERKEDKGADECGVSEWFPM